mgnify:CR=1 FL=1
MERLYLKWKDFNNNIYTLATLYKYENYYYLMIDREGITTAKKNGCAGIGTLDTNEAGYKSKELFGFFKNRILPKDSESLNKFLNKYNLEEYDEMKLLKATKGILGTDRYYLEEE